jgi:hypothetical protein
MSSAFTVYLVPFDQLKRVPGSKDQGLIEAIAESHEYFYSSIDELAEDDDVPTCREALEQIVNGEPLAEHLGYLYGYALEAICSHLGEELEGVSAISRASGWIEPVDAFLKDKGVPVTLTDLVFGRGPIDLPTPDDHPYIGCWPPEAITEAWRAIQGAEVTGLGLSTAETLRLIGTWLESAARTPGTGLMGVLS